MEHFSKSTFLLCLFLFRLHMQRPWHLFSIKANHSFWHHNEPRENKRRITSMWKTWGGGKKEPVFPLIFSITPLKSNAALSSLSYWRLLVHETSFITFISFLQFMPSSCKLARFKMEAAQLAILGGFSAGHMQEFYEGGGDAYFWNQCFKEREREWEGSRWMQIPAKKK